MHTVPVERQFPTHALVGLQNWVMSALLRKLKGNGAINDNPVEFLEEWCQHVRQLVDADDPSVLKEVEQWPCKCGCRIAPPSDLVATCLGSMNTNVLINLFKTNFEQYSI
jgi:hypothetical protein